MLTATMFLAAPAPSPTPSPGGSGDFQFRSPHAKNTFLVGLTNLYNNLVDNLAYYVLAGIALLAIYGILSLVASGFSGNKGALKRGTISLCVAAISAIVLGAYTGFLQSLYDSSKA